MAGQSRPAARSRFFAVHSDSISIRPSHPVAYDESCSTPSLADVHTTHASPGCDEWFGGARIARRDGSGTVFYFFSDQLGSSRVIVQAGQAAPCYDGDYAPFGSNRPVVNNCPPNYKFAEKERDTENTEDYLGARYYSSSLGRMLTPDPSGISLSNPANPQSLNLYSYVMNDPMNATDPTGMAADFIHGQLVQCSMDGIDEPCANVLPFWGN